MSTLLLTDQGNPRCVVAKALRPRTRVLTRLRASRLDRALAAGASADSNAALSMRAHALIGAPARRALARYIRLVLDDARHPFGPLEPGIPICRRKALASATTLLQIAERLTDGDPIDVRGVAMLRVLLIDSDGPMYQRPAVNDLEPALAAASAALDPSS